MEDKLSLKWSAKETFWLGITILFVVMLLDGIVYNLLDVYQGLISSENSILVSISFHSIFTISLLFLLSLCRGNCSFVAKYRLDKPPKVKEIVKFILILTLYILLGGYFSSFVDEPTQDLFLSDEFILDNLFICCIVLVMLVPFAEELFFRGFLYQGLVDENKNKYLGHLVICVLFTALHASTMSYIGLALIFISSVFLNYVRFKSNNLWLTIVLHMYNNLIALGFIYISVF